MKSFFRSYWVTLHLEMTLLLVKFRTMKFVLSFIDALCVLIRNLIFLERSSVNDVSRTSALRREGGGGGGRSKINRKQKSGRQSGQTHVMKGRGRGWVGGEANGHTGGDSQKSAIQCRHHLWINPKLTKITFLKRRCKFEELQKLEKIPVECNLKF